jgi:hypothetical protein
MTGGWLQDETDLDQIDLAALDTEIRSRLGAGHSPGRIAMHFEQVAGRTKESTGSKTEGGCRFSETR